MNNGMLVGIALAFVGFALFAGVLFSSGGVAKSRQFAVIGEVFAAKHGAGRRVAMIVGFVMMALGTCTTFAGVSAMDAARRDRCQDYCRQHGYTRGTIGPGDETPPGQPRRLACTCTRDDGARTQTPADSL